MTHKREFPHLELGVPRSSIAKAGTLDHTLLVWQKYRKGTQVSKSNRPSTTTGSVFGLLLIWSPHPPSAAPVAHHMEVVRNSQDPVMPGSKRLRSNLLADSKCLFRGTKLLQNKTNSTVCRSQRNDRKVIVPFAPSRSASSNVHPRSNNAQAPRKSAMIKSEY